MCLALARVVNMSVMGVRKVGMKNHSGTKENLQASSLEYISRSLIRRIMASADTRMVSTMSAWSGERGVEDSS